MLNLKSKKIRTVKTQVWQTLFALQFSAAFLNNMTLNLIFKLMRKMMLNYNELSSIWSGTTYVQTYWKFVSEQVLVVNLLTNS